jgi:uncharacterized protein YceK
MSKKTILFTLALMSAAPAFAAQGASGCLSVHTLTIANEGAPAPVASGTKSLRKAQPAQQTADDYAPSARSVYFGH